MNNLNFNVYKLDNYNIEDKEFIFQFNDPNDLQPMITSELINYCQPSLSITIPWRPSKKLRNLHETFQQTVLKQFPCLPCSNCGYLLYPIKAKWIPYRENVLYSLKKAFPSSKLPLHPQSPAHIAVCPACKNNPRRMFPHYLSP